MDEPTLRLEFGETKPSRNVGFGTYLVSDVHEGAKVVSSRVKPSSPYRFTAFFTFFTSPVVVSEVTETTKDARAKPTSTERGQTTAEAGATPPLTHRASRTSWGRSRLNVRFGIALPWFGRVRNFA